MNSGTNERYMIADSVCLDLYAEKLYLDNLPVKIDGKSYQLLKNLMSHSGQLLTKEELINSVWSGTSVTDGVLTTAIKNLRNAIGDDANNPHYIETAHRKGYRFVEPVHTETEHNYKPGSEIIVENNNPVSLAVLPLDNYSADPEQVYFVSGMHETLIASLSKLSALKVISRTSTQKYKDTQMTIPQIGKELNVDMIIEGSVYRVEDKIRITLQLIDAKSDDHIWAENFERSMSDVLTLQNELVLEIAEKIKINTSSDEQKQLSKADKVDPEIYNLYLKGMYHVNKAIPEEAIKGIAFLEHAVEQAPQNALSWAGLSLSYLLAAHGPEPPQDAYGKAKKAAAIALAIDENLADAYAALAECTLYSDWDWPNVEINFTNALSLNPSLAATRAHYSWALILFQKYDEALMQMKQAIELDPLTPLWPAWHGWQYWELGKYGEAIYHARKSLEIEDNFPVGLYVLGGALAACGRYDEAIQAHKKAAEISPFWDIGLAEDYALSGDKNNALKELAKMEKAPSVWDTFYIARAYIGLGDKDNAFKWLYKAYNEPHHPYIPWIHDFVSYRSLYDDPRFSKLVSKMNLPYKP
ncbi:MAG: winged helix-turn-helix domain-containing protein [Gammaproteobacteria bacterium]|nr:winged helix-turn-helix domain-containing protein [Gammaproteobacteria bacterium]